MKTPRDILFTRHQAAAPKLNAIRREVVAGLDNQATTQPRRLASLVAWLLGCPNNVWLELIWPCRRVWTGLATVWILIFIVNVSQRDNVSSTTGKTVYSSGPVMSLQVQQRWVNELLADRSLPPEADRPRNNASKPRTEISEPTTV